MRKSALIVASLAVTLIVGVSAAIVFVGRVPSPASGPPHASEVPTSNGVLIFVGPDEGMAGDAYRALQERTSGAEFHVVEVAALARVAYTLNASSVIVFNSHWLSTNIDEPALASFLDAALSAHAKVAAIGGNTSDLFVALEAVRPGIFAEGRNPAYDNPALAGYRLRDGEAPGGGTSQGESILVASPNDGAEAADSIMAWD